MYYIESEIEFISGISKLKLNFHRVSNLSVDYINNEFEFDIASYSSKNSFLSGEDASNITHLLLNVTDISYTQDLNRSALLSLISLPGTLFSGKEIKKDYLIKSTSQLGNKQE